MYIDTDTKELDIHATILSRDYVPLALFDCQTLEVLKLSAAVKLEVPLSICLPNLKEFHLSLYPFPSGDSVSRLVSSCPSLQHLVMRGHWFPSDPIIISSLSLRRLSFTLLDDLYSEERSKVVLDVPNLEYLVFMDTLALSYSIGELNALVEAKVNTISCYDYEAKDSLYVGTNTFLSSLVGVHNLFLINVKALEYCGLQLRLPVFRNLKHLQLGCSAYAYHKWSKILIRLLDCAPILETLSFTEGIVHHVDEKIKNYMDRAQLECEAWGCCNDIPSCLVSHLKRIAIKEYQLTQWELEMVKYFLRSTLLLEELIVVCKIEPTTADKILLNNTLQKLPRGSITCSIIVQ